MNGSPYYPLALQPWPREMIWGGRNLERVLHKTLPPGKKIGETWEAWDDCVIENGAQRGKTLGALIEKDVNGILGAVVTAQHKCPLLFKFIDAQDDLSVQVHPDDAAAQTFDNYPFGKTEAWYILHAEPGAAIIHGFQYNVSPEIVTDYLARDKLAQLLATVPVRAGDVVFVPPGTVHAITKGIVVAEIQENSDLTYRLYDWGRKNPDGKPRELHIAKSLQVANFKRTTEHQIAPLTIQHDSGAQQFLIACRYFALERLDLRAPFTALHTQGKFVILSLIHGAATITFGANLSESVTARHGQTFFLPASLGAFGITPQTETCQVLRAFAPNLRADVIEPLLRAGYSASEIARLGGRTPEHNDLLPLVANPPLQSS